VFFIYDVYSLSWVVGKVLQISRLSFFAISQYPIMFVILNRSSISLNCSCLFLRFLRLDSLSRFFVTCRILIGFVGGEIGMSG